MWTIITDLGGLAIFTVIFNMVALFCVVFVYFDNNPDESIPIMLTCVVVTLVCYGIIAWDGPWKTVLYIIICLHSYVAYLVLLIFSIVNKCSHLDSDSPQQGTLGLVLVVIGAPTLYYILYYLKGVLI